MANVFQDDHIAIDKTTGEDITQQYEIMLEQEEAKRQAAKKWFDEEEAKKSTRDYKGFQRAFFVGQEDGKRSNSYFVFLIYTPVKKFLEDFPNLTKGDYARLVYLSTFLKRNGTQIKMNRLKSAEVSDIKKLLDINERTSREFVKRAKESGLMYIDDEENVNLSDSAFRNGKVGRTTRQRHFSKLYIKNTRALYHAFKKGKAIEKLGTLYSLIPYLDLRYNVLCANANERIEDISDLEPLTMREVADILGVKEVYSLRRTLHALKVEIDGITHSLVATHETGATETALIAINPFFIYRDDHSSWMNHSTHLIFLREVAAQIKERGELDLEVEEVFQTILNTFSYDYEEDFY